MTSTAYSRVHVRDAVEAPGRSWVGPPGRSVRSRVGHIAAEFERLANVLLGRSCENPALITYPPIGTFITLNHLRLFKHGCRIRTPKTNLVVNWDEIVCIGFTYKRKTSIHFITGEKIFELDFNLTTGESVSIELKRVGFLWGIEFLYHNARIKKLVQVLNRHTLVRELVTTGTEANVD
jgi:hypothetical protein